MLRRGTQIHLFLSALKNPSPRGLLAGIINIVIISYTILPISITYKPLKVRTRGGDNVNILPYFRLKRSKLIEYGRRSHAE